MIYEGHLNSVFLVKAVGRHILPSFSSLLSYLSAAPSGAEGEL
jgi:hypothetical protein